MKYQATEFQKHLLKQDIDISRLTVLQRKSLTRLQFFSFRHKNFIRSISDEFKNLRIIVLSLLVKFYSNYSQKNLKRLNIIKEILYQSNLEALINNKGLQKQQLHKCICVQLQKLTIGFQVQSHIMSMFNCISFFDQIVLRSIQQKFIQLGEAISIQFVQKWIKQNLFITICWNLEDLEQEKQDQLFLWRDNQSIYRQSSANMVFIEQSEQTSQNNQKKSKQQQGQEIRSGQKKTASKLKLYQTISVASSISPYDNSQSPNVDSNSKYRNNVVNPFINEDSLLTKIAKQKQNINFQRQLNFHEKDEQKKHMVKKSKNNKNSFFWIFFCCGCEKQKEKQKYINRSQN